MLDFPEVFPGQYVSSFLSCIGDSGFSASTDEKGMLNISTLLELLLGNILALMKALTVCGNEAVLGGREVNILWKK